MDKPKFQIMFFRGGGDEFRIFNVIFLLL